METTWGELSSHLLEIAKIKKIPLIGSFELTSRCNLRCSMCYVHSNVDDIKVKDGELSAEQWINIAIQAREAGMLYLLLTGGEVFLRDDFLDIYEYLSNIGFNIQIYTNATLITPKIAEFLNKNPPSKISVTLYGASSETYGKVTGHADGYIKAIKGIELLIDAGINVQLKTTVIKSNKNDYAALSEFAYKRNLELGIINYISPHRDDFNSNSISERLSSEELVDFEIDVAKYRSSKQQADLGITKKKSSFIKHKTNIYNDYPFRCTVGKSSFWITWDGRMIPCSIMSKPSTLPLNDNFAHAWQELVQLLTQIPVCQTCKDCTIKSFCESCPARLLNETNSFIQPAPYLCKTAFLRNKYNHKIIKNEKN